LDEGLQKRINDLLAWGIINSEPMAINIAEKFYLIFNLSFK
jgi:hypothetical protein